MAIGGGCFGGRSAKYTVTKPLSGRNVRENVPKDRRVSTTPMTPKVVKATDKVLDKVTECLDGDVTQIYSKLASVNIKGKAEGSPEQLRTVAHRLSRRALINTHVSHIFNRELVSLTIGEKEDFGRISVAEPQKLSQVTLYLTHPQYHNDISFSLELAVTREIRAEVDTNNMLYKVCSVLEDICLGHDCKKELLSLFMQAKINNDELPFHVMNLLVTLVKVCDEALVGSEHYQLGNYDGKSAKDLFSKMMMGNIRLLKTSAIPLLHAPHTNPAFSEAEKATITKIVNGSYDAMEVVKECLIKAERYYVYEVTTSEFR